MGENRNLFLAIILSMIVLLGWQYFVAGPQMEKARQAELARQTEQTGTQSPSGAPANGAAATPGTATPDLASAGGAAADAPVLTRDEALAKSPRVVIDTPELSGSIRLIGAQIDDLSLKNYRETVSPTSPMVTLLSPLGGPHAYYAETGFVTKNTSLVLPRADTLWTAPANAKLTPDAPLVLTYDNGAGLLFTREIKVDSQSMFTITDKVENKSANPAELNPYGFLIRHGAPAVQGTWVLHEGLLGVFGDAGLSEVKYSALKDAAAIKPEATKTGWLGITDKYWAAALIPPRDVSFQPRFLHTAVGTTDTYQADFISDPVIVAPGASASNQINIFAGPKTVSQINAYNDQMKLDRFDLMIDWGWFGFLTRPMFWLLDSFYKLVGNFGVAVLLVTVVVKTLFFPLANKSYASMSKMKKIQPEMEQIKVAYKDDRARQQQAMMELYKKEKINPVAGCLPMLIQIPVFFALYKVLYGTIEMRHAPFFGWIQDLSAPDPTSLFNLFGLLPYDVPHVLLIGVWPLIMGVTMFVQMKLNPAPTDPTQAMIFTWMPIVFTFMLSSFPAGLVIYWAWNNSLSILQQSIIMKRHGVKIELFDNIRSMFSKKAKQGG